MEQSYQNSIKSSEMSSQIDSNYQIKLNADLNEGEESLSPTKLSPRKNQKLSEMLKAKKDIKTLTNINKIKLPPQRKINSSDNCKFQISNNLLFNKS
jgi:hypothetical protein